MSTISEMLQQRSCQAKTGKCAWETWATERFQKRQNNCKCHVRLEGADLLSLYTKIFYWGQICQNMLAKTKLLSEYDASVQVLKSGQYESYPFFHSWSWKTFSLCTSLHVACRDLPQPVNASKLVIVFEITMQKSLS